MEQVLYALSILQAWDLEGRWCETLLAAFFWLEVVGFMTYGLETLHKQHGKLVDEHPKFLIKRGVYNPEAFLVTV